MDDGWVTVGKPDDLAVGSSAVVSAHGRQIALFRTALDQVHAVDNLCPHEGYPLVQGAVKGCVLTCAWHNYKFDLRDGRCLQGDEDAGAYDVELRDGGIALRASPADRGGAAARHLASLRAGLLDGAIGRAARDAVRLLAAGTDPVELLWEAARLDAERGEYGCTHALPVAADLAAGLLRYPGLEAALPISVALECAAEPNVRRPPRPAPAASDPGPDPAAAGQRLHELVEDEEVAAAEALLRGALAAGWPRRAIEPWLLGLCSAHFLSFGHGLIYTVKAFDLLERVGWARAAELLPALLVHLATGTREDVLPPMRSLADRLRATASRWPAWRRGTAADFDRRALQYAVVDGSRQQAAAAVEAALAAGAAAAALAGALVDAAAQRLLRFDVALDADATVQEGWLDVTHGLTFAAAARRALSRTPDPGALRLLFYAAHFVNRTKRLDLPPAQRPEWTPRPCRSPAAVVEAIEGRDAELAVGCAAGYLDAAGDPAALRAALEDYVLRRAGVRPVVVAHLIKTTAAAFDEAAADAGAAAAAGAAATAPAVLAAVRLLASPIAERRTAQLAHEAIRFAGLGKPPRRLT